MQQLMRQPTFESVTLITPRLTRAVCSISAIKSCMIDAKNNTTSFCDLCACLNLVIYLLTLNCYVCMLSLYRMYTYMQTNIELMTIVQTNSFQYTNGSPLLQPSSKKRYAIVEIRKSNYSLTNNERLVMIQGLDQGSKVPLKLSSYTKSHRVKLKLRAMFFMKILASKKESMSSLQKTLFESYHD